MQAASIKLYDEKRQTSELSFVNNGGRGSKDPVSENCIVCSRYKLTDLHGFLNSS